MRLSQQTESPAGNRLAFGRLLFVFWTGEAAADTVFAREPKAVDALSHPFTLFDHRATGAFFCAG